VSKLKRPNSSEMCPPGFHIVHGHKRTCHSGLVTWVDTHLRHNRGMLYDLRKENLLYLFWNNEKTFPQLKRIVGFKQDDGELDSVVQFWLQYWKDQGLKVSEIDPVLLKSLIAIESGFDPNATSKESTAFGLMQITSQARRVMNGTPDSNGYREMRSDFVAVSKEDIADPVVNIATGIRWLFHKYSQIPKGNDKNVFNNIKNYHSWDDDGKAYANSVISLFEKSEGSK
jgi:hypothetical protein